MSTMRGVRAVMAVLLLGATALCATGCAADAEPEPNLPPKQVTLSAPGVVDTTPDTNQAPEAPAPSQTNGTGGTGAQVVTTAPRITPKPSQN